MYETNERLKELMREHGLRTYAGVNNKDVPKIAEMLSVSTGAVRKWLSGERRMSEGSLELLEIKMMLLEKNSKRVEKSS